MHSRKAAILSVLVGTPFLAAAVLAYPTVYPEGVTIHEAGVVLKHDIGIDAFEEALFEDQQVGAITAPRAVSRPPLRRCCQPAPVDCREPFRFRERPGLGQLAEPLAQPIVTAVEID